MTENTTASGAADQYPSLYERTGNIEDINTLLVPRAALAASAPVAPTQPAPMPYPTDAQVDAVYEQTMGQHLRSQDAPAVRRFGRAIFFYAWNAAAPKADQIEDGLAMVPAPLQPDWCELRRLHALAVADADADRILAEWRAYKPAPLQQGEHPPLPQPDTHCYDEDTGMDVWSYSAEQMHTYLDAHLAARGAAQAAPANNGDSLTLDRLVSALEEAERNGALHFSLEGPLQEAREAIEANQPAAPAPVAEDEIRKALDDAATALETISRIAGRDKDMLGMMDVRLYAASRARVAREAQAAQPEGGATA